MRKNICLILILSVILGSCATGRKSLERGDYSSAISKAVNRLSNDPNNRKAAQVVRDGYPMAIAFYQEEIDQALTGNDPFKWKHVLDVMLTVNSITDQVRRIPAARKLVGTFKSYTTELADVQNRAAGEYYDAASDQMRQNTREAFKQAYFNFQEADNLVPGFKDSRQKMLQSKDLATLKVVIEQIPVNGKYEYSAQFFYDNVLQMLDQHFQEKDFVHFFTPDQAEKSDLKYPDMILQMGFYDFYIGRPQHFEEEKELSKQVEESYKVKVSKDSTVTKTRQVLKRGKIRIATDQVESAGLLELKAIDFQSQKVIFSDKIPGQFTWRNQYGIFVGDNEVLDQNLINILNNKAVPPPGPQDMFVLFTKPIFNQLSSKLVNYFGQYN